MRFDMTGNNSINDLTVTLDEHEALEVTPYAIHEAKHATLLMKDDEGRFLRLKGSPGSLRRFLVGALASMEPPVEPREAREVA